MAQLKDLLVAGASRFIGDAYANKLQLTSLSAPTSAGGTTYGAGTNGNILRSNGTSLYWGTLAAADIPNLSTDKLNSGTLPVGRGGTGATTFTSGEVLIGNGTNAVSTRAILNNTSKSAIGWNSGGATNANNLRLINVNTISYWNGAYADSSSNLSILGTITTGTWNASTIGIAYGGTGKTSAVDAANLFLDSLTAGSSDPVDGDTYIASYADGKNVDHNGTNTYHRRPIVNLYNYIKSKLAVTNDNTSVTWDTETTIATIGGTAIKIKIPANLNYGKITPANSTSTSALTGNTTAVESSSPHENLKISAGNKWIVLAGTNSSTAGNDELKIAHTAPVTAKTAYGSTATTASANGGTIKVTDIQYDAAGHITASTDRTITLSQTTYTLSGLGGVGTVSASGTAPLTLSASKSGTTVTLTGSVSAASTSASGVVQLNSAINSTSTTQAATPSAVKSAYDLADGKTLVQIVVWENAT